ncbi:MAG: DUF4235 domain-containing protein [Solirubrobacteraceae bacterium]
MLLLRLLYKPFAIVAGLISARIGRALFRALWSRVDERPPPRPGDGTASATKTVGGEALKASIMAAAAAAVDRAFASAFHHIIGIWPKKPPKPDED